MIGLTFIFLHLEPYIRAPKKTNSYNNIPDYKEHTSLTI